MEGSAHPSLMSMNDFALANPYVPPPPRGPTSKIQPLRLQENDGRYATLFNTACQAKGLTPEFIFHEPSQGAFVVTLRVDNQMLDQLGPYATKKDAKEDICRLAIDKVDVMQSRKRDKNSLVDTIGFAAVPGDLGEENWTGTLTEYCQSNKLSYPTFSDNNAHPSQGPFFCTVRFSGSPLTEFGSNTAGFRNKKDAKQVASREAVLWLRSQGYISTDDQRMTPAVSTDVSDILPNFGNALDVNSSGAAPQGSIGRQVQDLCLSLGFGNPEFEVVPLPGSFYTMQARFLDKDVMSEPRLAGSVGSVHNVYAKKAAKDACWREVLKVLEDIRRSRLQRNALI